MKISTLLLNVIFFTSIFVSLNAQDYHPFPETNTRWSGFYTGHHEESPQVKGGYYWETDGDTIIDGLAYRKLHYKDTWRELKQYTGVPDEVIISTSNSEIPRKLVGGLRQDVANKKVYFRYFGSTNCACFDYTEVTLNEDFLLYDFDLEVGDSHSLYDGEGIVTSIDTFTLLNGDMRRRYILSNFEQRELIEGIGATNGLFGFLHPVIFEGSCDLGCVRDGDELLYSEGSSTVNMVFNCDSIAAVVVGTEDLVNPFPNLKVFPNPLYNVVTIQGLDPTINDYQISIFNLLGEKIMSRYVDFQPSIDITVSNLPAGVYVLDIITNSNVRASQKIIKLE
jgi:hypothetical protein